MAGDVARAKLKRLQAAFGGAFCPLAILHADPQ